LFFFVGVLVFVFFDGQDLVRLAFFFAPDPLDCCFALSLHQKQKKICVVVCDA